jgi:cysteine desulfurase
VEVLSLPEIYLDNSATTPLYPEVLALMNQVQEHCFGNPSAMHEKGIEAEKMITAARRQVAHLLGVSDREVIFTSGGTEANNLAICGAARHNRKRGNHLITSVIEHPSVLNCFRYLEREGFEVTYLPVDHSGMINLEQLEHEITPATTLVSIMHVNNEIGTVLPLAKIGPVIKAKNRHTLFHTDAVQSFTKLPLDPRSWKADLLSCSSHKIHGPKGAGCLWINKGKQIDPLLHGGGQETGLRSGTENTAAIAGFGLAAELSGKAKGDQAAYLIVLKKAFMKEIEHQGNAFSINGPDLQSAAPQIINLAFPGLKAEMLLHSLEEKNIYVSAGSACHSRHPEPSHVLKAIGLQNNLLDGSLRFSFSVLNSVDEVIVAARETAAAVKRIKALIN